MCISHLQIFLKKREEFTDLDAEHWVNFLQCLPGLTRISNQIDDLEAILKELWALYAKLVDTTQGKGLAGLYELFLFRSLEAREAFTANYLTLKAHLEQRYRF